MRRCRAALLALLRVANSRGAAAHAQVRLEPAAPVGATAPSAAQAGLLFPQLYGPLDLSAVVRTTVITRSEDGTYVATGL